MESENSILMDDEIVNSLNAFFESNVTVNELRQPKPEFVQTIYCNFLQDFGISLDQTNVVPLGVNDSVRQYPEAYQSIVRSMVIAGKVRDFLKELKCIADFLPGDFMDPDPKRTRIFFSSLINYYLFVSHNMDNLIEIEARVECKVEGKEKQLVRIAEKKERIQQLKRDNEEVIIREEQMQKRIVLSREELNEDRVNSATLKNQLEQLKLDVATLTTDVKAGEIAILEKRELLEKLASQVVLESEFKQLEELENLAAKLNSENAEKEACMANLGETLELCKSSVEFLKTQLLPALQENQEAIAITKKINAEQSQQDTNIKHDSEEIGDYEMKMQHLNEVLLTRQEKLSQMQDAWNVKKASLLEMIEQLKQAHKKMLQNQTEDEIASQDLIKERTKIIRVTQQFKEQIQEFDIIVATNYQRILQAMEEHNNGIQQALKAAQESVSKIKERH